MNRLQTVKLLVDDSEDSNKARRLLYSIEDPRIDIDGVPACGDIVPIAFWNGFSYRGVHSIKQLKEKLEKALEKDRI